MKSFLTATVLFAVSIQALDCGPRPTAASEDATSLDQGWTPKPTEKVAVGLNELRRRATSSGSLIGYNAPDNTCGFISGNLGNPLTCDPVQSCAAVSHSVGGGGLILCCANPNTCYWYSDCVDSASVTLTSVCDDLCQKDNFVLKCTEPSAPYCAGFRMSMYQASAYSCNSNPVTTYQFIASTYNGEHPEDFTSWQPVFDGQSAFASASSSAASSSTTSSSSSSKPATSSSSTPTPTPTPQPKKSNVGPIAGGVVAGLAVLGAVVVGVVWLCLRNRRRRNGNPAAAPNQPMQPGYPPMQQQQGPPVDGQQWQQQPTAAAANMPYMQYQDPTKPGFQTQNQPLLNADYHGHGHPTGISPPTSPAPQYTAAGMDRQSMVKPDNTGVSPIGHDGAHEVEARPHVPNLGRDGTPVYEVQ